MRIKFLLFAVYFQVTLCIDSDEEILENSFNISDIRLTNPPCFGGDGKLIVRRLLDNERNLRRVKCVKEPSCVVTKAEWEDRAFTNFRGYCLEENHFKSQEILCGKLNATRGYQSDVCFTALERGSPVDLGQYLLTYQRGVTIKVPNHDLLRLDTLGVDFIPANESIYIENVDGTPIYSQNFTDSRVPLLRVFDVPRIKVSLSLSFTPENSSVHLHCYNCDYLGELNNITLGCNTVDDYGHQVTLQMKSFRKVNPRLEIFTVQQFQPQSEGYRYYFCEGLTIFNAEKVVSEKILVGFQDPLTLSLAFFMKADYILDNRTTFLSQFKKEIKVQSARIVKIVESKVLMHALVSNAIYTIKSFRETLRKKFGDQFLGTVNSTDYCYSETFNGSRWKTVKPGQTSFLDDFRMRNKHGAPMSRKCIGDFEYGAVWEPILEKPIIKEVDQKTRKWKDIAGTLNESNVNQHLVGLTNDVCRSTWNMEATSVVVLADVFDKFKMHKETIDENNVESLSEVCSKLLEQPSESFEQSKETNMTNVLLSSIEEIFDEAFTRETKIFNEKGVCFTIQDKFSVFSIDPQRSNVRGLAFYKKGGKNRLQEGNIFYSHITSDQTLDSFKAQKDLDLDIATYFPEELLTFLNPTKSKTFRIVIKVYSNDNLFQTTNDTTPNQDVEDKVISISVPGYSSEFPNHFLPILFRTQGKHPGCYYWNYDTWVTGGIDSATANSDFIYCQVNHLTPFTRITDIRNDISTDSRSYKALNILTTIGLSLSLLGVVGILVATYFIPEMRFSKSSKIMIQITVALLVEIVLFFISGSKGLQKHEKMCVTMGSLLQYIILVKFVWMTIIAVTNWLSWYSPFKYGARRDANENKIEIWLVGLGWGAPVVPVFFSVIFASQPEGLDFCFPSGNVKIWGFLVLMYTMFTAICVFFVLLLVEFQKMVKTNVRGNNKEEVIKLMIGNVRLLIFSMGIPWFFGALHMIFSGGTVYATIFAYLFCIFVPLQGFFMFVFLVVFNPRVQGEVRKRLEKKKCTRKDEETTASTRLTTSDNVNSNTERISLQDKRIFWQNNPLYKKRKEVV